MTDFADTRALVTGSTSGIGRVIAQVLVDAGATVGVTALPDRVDRATATAAELDPTGRRARAYGLDVRSVESIDSAFAAFEDDLGPVSLLVNNAGVRLVAPSITTGEADWDEVMSVNVRGVFFCAQAAARRMKDRGGGAIVNVASQLGAVVSRDRAAYSTSKAAVMHLTRALALDWAPYGIRVNGVAPGPTQTSSMPVGSDPESALEFLTRMPLGRPIDPAEVAHAVLYLAGSHAAATTGQTLILDGGWTLP
jgi:NAD(P)-dependent dehydrogenase (short-subunit alcohol dehydrogenase family)